MSTGNTEKRGSTDRRKGLSPFNKYLFFGGRRNRIRRELDKKKHFVLLDYYSPRLFVLLIAILLCSYADAFLTLILNEKKVIAEANPIMAFHLDRGILPFVVNKFFLTAVPVVILCLLHKNPIARTGLKFIAIAYAFIITYQLYLTYITHY
ncbi:MAG: hypothetical protein HY756_07830 [Nitrospirae bacterium]|nr:hypothetical protein [Nitrospirota bacterium]